MREVYDDVLTPATGFIFLFRVQNVADSNKTIYANTKRYIFEVSNEC